MEDEYFYSTMVEWTGERHGDLSAPVLPSLHVDAPPEFKGHAGAWTPEHLFVAAVNSCFMTTFLAIAENSKLEFVSFKAEAEGKLEKSKGRGLMMTEVTLRPRLVISQARDIERASRILEKAERNCLISNSVKAEVRLESEVTLANSSESGSHMLAILGDGGSAGLPPQSDRFEVRRGPATDSLA